MSQPDLSIVIVSYNTRELLRLCLYSIEKSLARTPNLLAEIWVVDNASEDGSVEMIREGFPQIRLIACDSNAGFARANNIALAQATGRYFLLLNPDTEIRGDALGQAVEFLDQNLKVGGVGIRLLYPDGRLQQSVFHFPTLPMVFLDFFPLNHRLTNSRLNGRYLPRELEKPRPIDHPLGAFFMVRAEVVRRVGLLDELFFMYCEEIDWAMRIWGAGYSLYYLPTAEIVHYEGQSAKQFRERTFVHLHQSRARLFDKHYGPLFNFLTRRITRLAMRVFSRRVRLALAVGAISPAVAEAEFRAYRRVGEIE